MANITISTSKPTVNLTSGRVGSVSAAWGTISGTLANQTDLQAALDAKEPTITATSTNQYYRGDKTFQTLDTSVVPENGNLYYADSRARAALSVTAPLIYNSTTGAFSVTQASGTTDGYLSSTDWNTFNNKQNTLVSGTNIKTINGNSLLGAGDVSTSVSWGSISGVLDNQTDLQGALNAKADTSSLATVATTGSYTDLLNQPTIPTTTSELTNDSGYITSSQAPVQSVNTQTGDVVLTTAEVNDSLDRRYVTDAQRTVIQNTSGVNTGDQDLSGYATTTSLDNHTSDLAIHREINDAGVATTDLWSADKISTELAGKANSIHTHVATDITDFDAEVSNNTDVSSNTAARHSHTNKALLDTYTQTEADLADAVTKKHTPSTLGTKTVDETNIGNAKVLAYNTTSGNLEYVSQISGVSDHGDLAGLSDDDHTQYHTDTRADTWLSGKTLDDIAAGTTNKHFTSADETKLDGIEAGADVTDTANVTAAGAVMDTELIDTTTGVTDAGKPIKLNASGVIDSSMYTDNDTTDHTLLSNIGTNSHAQIDTHIADAAKHREINDAGVATTDLWSADKISTELASREYSTVVTVGFSDADYTVPNQSPTTSAEITANTTAIQNAIDSIQASGGKIVFKQGTYITNQLTVYSNITLQGQGKDNTIIKLADGANSSLIVTSNFATLTGTNSTAGVYGVTVRDLTLDGNKANNTSAGATAGEYHNYHAVLKIYGYSIILDNCIIQNGKDLCLYSEWSASANEPANSAGMESFLNNVRIAKSDNTEVVWRGSHDSMWNNVVVFGYATNHLIVESSANYSGGPLEVNNVHIWGACSGDGVITQTTDSTIPAYIIGNMVVEGAGFGGGSSDVANVRLKAGGNSLTLKKGFFNSVVNVAVESNDNNLDINSNLCSGDALRLGTSGSGVGGNVINLKSEGDDANGVRFYNNGSVNNTIFMDSYKDSPNTHTIGTVPTGNRLDLYKQGTAAGGGNFLRRVGTSRDFTVDESGRLDAHKGVFIGDDGQLVYVGNSTQAVFSINTLPGFEKFELVNGASFRGYSDGYSTLTWSVDSSTGNITTSGTVDGRDVSDDGSTLDTHIASTSNPHSVTASQVGLGNVQNVDQTNASNITAGTLADARLSSNIAKLNTAQEYTATQSFNMTTLTDGATINWDLSANQVATVTLGGNRTLANPTNQVAGATYLLIVKQDATGSRTLTFGGDYKFPEGTDPTLSTGANAVDILSFVSDGTNMYGVASLNFS